MNYIYLLGWIVLIVLMFFRVMIGLAIHILEQKVGEVDWNILTRNPGIFVPYDYEAMKKTRDPITRELMTERFHPKHIEKFESWGFD